MRLLLIVASVFALTASVGGDTLEVPGSFATIGDALTAASDGDTVAIAAGTYVESDLYVEGVDISIVGELDSTGSPAVTVDADGAGIIFAIGINGTSGTTLEGLRLTGASGNAVWIYHLAPTIRNCTFTENTLALWCRSGNPTIADCLFFNNSAGAVEIRESTGVISGCTFVGNSAFAGGGVKVQDTSGDGLLIVDCIFDGNKANYGAGVQISGFEAGQVTIEGCTFLNHVENPDGGPNELGSAINTNGIDLVIRDSSFTGNETGGGVLFANGGAYELEGCTFEDNIDLIFGGGSCCLFNGDVNLGMTNCVFSNNASTGVSIGGFSTASIVNCQFVGNTSSYTAGLVLVQTDALVDGCEFRGNVAQFGTNAGALYHYPGSLLLSNSLFCENEGDPEDIDGPWTDGGGNEFSEACAAPCPSDVNNDGVTDGADLSLILGFWGACSDPLSCPYDITGDGTIGGADLSIVLGYWGRCP